MIPRRLWKWDVRVSTIVSADYTAFRCLIYDFKGYPIIVRNKKPWHAFLASRIEEVGEKAIKKMKSIIKKGMPNSRFTAAACKFRWIKTPLARAIVRGHIKFSLFDPFELIFRVANKPRCKGGRFVWQLHELGTKPFLLTPKQKKIAALIFKGLAEKYGIHRDWKDPAPEYRRSLAELDTRMPEVSRMEVEEWIGAPVGIKEIPVVDHPGVAPKYFIYEGSEYAIRNIEKHHVRWIKSYVSYCIPFFRPRSVRLPLDPRDFLREIKS